MLMQSALSLVSLSLLSGVLAFAPQDAKPAADQPAPKAEPKAPSKMTTAQALAKLKAQEGTWDAEVTFWLKGLPEPVKSKAVVTARMIMDGKFLEQKIEGGDFGPAMGNAKWSSMSMTGYNETTGQFEAARFGSMTSVMIIVKGSYAPDGKTISMSGEYDFMGGKATNRDVITDHSADSVQIDSYMSFAGSPEFKGSEMKLTRRK